uniref:Uncharacterized protein n=1 Tax=Cucumis melo TaxID=3656 RepID=A0A9I9EHT6_CUCME
MDEKGREKSKKSVTEVFLTKTTRRESPFPTPKHKYNKLKDNDLELRKLLISHGTPARTVCGGAVVDGEEDDLRITHLSERQKLRPREKYICGHNI